MPKTVLVDDNERIDRPDFEAVASAPSDFARDTPANMLTSPNGTSMWILDGFGVTSPVASQVRVTRGRAFLRRRRAGVVEPGVLVSEGELQKTINISAFADSPLWKVWIRAETSDGDIQNRIFWDAIGVAENPAPLATRQTQSWGMRVALTSPGGEWFQIGTVTIVAGSVTLVTQQREFYFEGAESASYVATTSRAVNAYGVWGGGNDRDPDRATYGVKDLQTFTAAVRSQLADALGQPWYAAVTEPLNQKVSRNGDLGLNGNYRVVGDLHVVSQLTVDAGASFGAGATVTGTLSADKLSVSNSISPGTPPDPDVCSWLTLANTDSSVNSHVAMYMLLSDTEVSPSRDGVAIIAKRMGADDTQTELRFHRVSNSAVAAGPTFTLDLEDSTFYTAFVSASGDVVANGVHPTGLNRHIGEAANRWDTSHVGQVYAYATGAHPSTQQGVMERNQRNNIVARVSFVPGVVPTWSITDVWNVDTVARNGGAGKYRITLDQPVSVGCSVMISCSRAALLPDDSSLITYHHFSSPTQLDVFLMVGDLTNNAHNDLVDAITVTIVGEPNVLQ